MTRGASLKRWTTPSRSTPFRHGLGLGLTGGQGLSLNALIGLTATEGTVKLPLASWGRDTAAGGSRYRRAESGRSANHARR